VRYASVSKHFLTSLLLSGAPIGLDDTLGDHLPLQPALAAVPVGRALDMTAGLPDVMETLWQLGNSPTTSLGRDALLTFAQSIDALNFAPGTQISYSNTGYRLVQAALEAKGVDYAKALHERFFRPLGLGITLPEDETDPVPNLAGGYWKSPRGWLRGRYGLHISASGGLAGSARDLMTWCQALLAGTGPADGLLARLGAQRRLADGTVTGYGLGLARAPVPGVIAIGHGGSLPGFKNHFLLAPALGAGVVVVTNREDSDAHGISLRVMAALANATLAAPATGVLPSGRFVDEKSAAWLEHAAGQVTFLGAAETVYPANGGVAGRSVHLPVELAAVTGGLEGRIGHAAYRFRPVAPDLAAPKAWAGTWLHDGFDARFTVTVTDGAASLVSGSGPQREVVDLAPLSDGLGLAERAGGGPWKQRLCLAFDGDTVRLITNRSRVLRLRRAG
jgi:CubicO group peptidase (beta-lactamase class C family)